MPEKIRTRRAAALLSVGYAVAGYLLAFEERDLIAGLGDTTARTGPRCPP